MALMAGLVSFFADILRIVEHLFFIALLGFASMLLCGRMAEKFVTWINSRRLRVDCSPHESRGWFNG